MMTRKEAIVNLEKLIALFHTASEQSKMVDYSKIIEVLEFAAAALHSVSRKQVEKVWKSEWKCHGDCGVTECSACGWNIEEYVGNYNFCPACGATMTEEAVEMVMKRMEALHETV